MSNFTRTLKAGISLLILSSSLSMTACSKKLTAITPMPSTMPTTPVDNSYPPDDSYYYPPDNNNSTNGTYPSTPTGTPNTQAGTFKVDQDLAHSWQAKGIAVSGGTIYVSASDSSGLSKKGTVVKMNASDGKNWKDLASSFLGMRHPMDATVTGLAISGGTILAADSASKMYTVDASKGSVKVIKTAGGTDVAAAAGGFYIANGMIEKSDSSGSSRAPVGNLPSNGGIGADNMGSVYSVSGNVIKKADTTGQVFDVVTTDLMSPLDVAIDNRNGDIYVLEQSMIKRFNTNGQFVVSFSNGATKPVGIAVDETGAVFVADGGSSSKDSKVVKFSAAIDNAGMNSGYGDSYGSGYNNYSNNSYDSYGNTNTNYGTGYNDYSSYSNTRTASTTQTRTASTTQRR